MSATIVGLTIAKVRELTTDELEHNGWSAGARAGDRPYAIELSDGTLLYASSDPEGNGPGCMFGSDGDGDFYLEVQP